MDEIIALFDMDNTLFDYEGKLLEDLNKLRCPDEPKQVTGHGDKNPWIKARRHLIQSIPGWWRDLPTFKLGWDIYHMADAMDYECHVLTKGPYKYEQAWTEKVQCIRKWFGEKVDIDIVGKDKKHRYGRVLVDDYPPYVLGWLEHRPRGLAIMPAHSYNENVNHPNLIRYDGFNAESVQSALRAAKTRNRGEHWKDYL